MIPTRGGKRRRLGIRTVADRVVQAALKTVLEPILEVVSAVLLRARETVVGDADESCREFPSSTIAQLPA